MNITNSPDISTLEVEVTWDISNQLPQILLLNQSTGGNLAGCVWAFTATSPSQTPIHSGDIDNPDVTGAWTNFTLSDGWPRPFSQIEFSGAPYSFFVVVKDSNGNVYTAPVQYTNICRPVGNSDTSKNTYGLALSDVKVKCQEAGVFFQDTTYHTYQGQSGTQYSSVLTVIYPIDETLTIPPKFVAAQYVTAIVPITYSSKNYQFVQTVIYDYAVGDNSIVRVRYQTIQTFSVFCNVDLLPLVCEINKLLDQVESGNCADMADAQRKMNLVVGKFALVMIGIEQPLTGVDVPVLIDEIIAIGDFDCNCCSAPSGIIPTTSSVIGGYNFLVNKLGGDVAGNFSTNGNNITLNISDVSYVVTIGNQSPSNISAFSFTSEVSGNGYLKTYKLNIDGVQLASDILNIIKGNVALVNLFNSIVNIPSGGWNLIADTSCLGIASNACDYVFTLSNISSSPANSILAQIQSSAPVNNRTLLNYAFNLSTLSNLQSYLNTLGIGVFVVTNLGGGNISITSNANNFSLTKMSYSPSGGINTFANFSSDCTGFIPLTANEVVQAIIDYLCGLTDNQMVTSQDYIICSIDPVSKIKTLTTVVAGTKENELIAQILDKNCDIVDYLLGINGVNCNSMKALFPSLPTAILQNTDYLFGTKQGQCAGINPVEAATRMLQLGVYNADFMVAFCNAVALCAGGQSCEPYTIFQVAGIDTSPSTNNMNLVVTFTHPSAISNTIRYARIDNTISPVYTTITGVLPGLSPYTIPNVPDGQYFVGITPIYSDGRSCSEVSTTTAPCTGITAFSAIVDGSGNIVISYTAVGTLPKIKVTINYPNGGTASTVYNNTGTNITITPPTGVTGDYYITLTPICNSVTGFEGTPTAPVILTVKPTNNSTITNNTSTTLSPVMVTLERLDVSGTYVPVNITLLKGAGADINYYNFYIPDGVYGNVFVLYSTGAVGNGYLIASSGTGVSVPVAGGILFNTGFTSVGGVQIILTDPSPAV